MVDIVKQSILVQSIGCFDTVQMTICHVPLCPDRCTFCENQNKQRVFCQNDAQRNFDLRDTYRPPGRI